ncbi:MAG: imidazole glycerol phosphate synthase subunit HisH [Candidatus Omnitrophota bacterium]
MIAVIDYGLGNIRSVSKALERVGAKVKVTDSPGEIAKAEALVFPGVGAFRTGMKNLKEKGILAAILDAVKKDKPFLGICLGFQLLFSESEEHGPTKGLDIIKGKVIRFTGKVKVPHMGWNTVKLQSPQPTAHSPQLFDNIPNDSYFYFVHSYYAVPEDKSVVIATTKYGIEFASVVNKGNVWGVQFHPEKSSDFGLKILENFVKNVS